MVNKKSASETLDKKLVRTCRKQTEACQNQLWLKISKH